MGTVPASRIMDTSSSGFVPINSSKAKKMTCLLQVCNCAFYSFPGGSVVKNPPANVGDMCSIPILGRCPGEGFLPGKPHGQRSLAGYSPWGHKSHHLTTKQQNKNN